MDSDNKLLSLSIIELAIAIQLALAAAIAGFETVESYRYWELFSVFLSAFLVTIGLREMRKIT